MSGHQLIDLTQATLRDRRIGKPALKVHEFFRAWLKDHRADLRAAFHDPNAEIELDLEALWTACGFNLHDEILVWWAQHSDSRGFEGDGIPPWHDAEQTLALLARARDWEPRPVREPVEKLSWSERRSRERELLRMERAVISEVMLRQLEQDAAWGRRPR